MAGQLLIPLASICVIPITFESDFGSAEKAWGLSWLFTAFLVAGAGLAIACAGWTRRRTEIRRGYTSLANVYSKSQDLFLVDPASKAIWLDPVLPWRSLDDDRRSAAQRGERAWRPDNSRLGRALAQDKVVEIAQRQDRALKAQLPVRRGIVIGATVLPLACLGVRLGLVWLIPSNGTSGNQQHGDNVAKTYTISHARVEKQIEVYDDAQGVSCNGGHDIKATSAGDMFSCLGSNGESYTVTVTDPRTGAITVS